MASEGKAGIRWVQVVAGVLLGMLFVVTIPIARWVHRQATGGPDGGEPLPQPDPRVKGEKGSAIAVGGEAFMRITDVALDDPEGHRVMQVDEVKAQVDLDALRSGRLSMPKGSAKGIRLLIRRGPSGQVSLSEAMHGGDPPSKAEREQKEHETRTQPSLALDVGPLEAKDIRLTIAMSDNPVVLQVNSAHLRVQRKHGHGAPRIYLSHIHGRLVKPDPLPNPIEIHDGEGVVDLTEGPLVDMRVRVCLSRGELRLQIRVPKRNPETTKLVADADHFLGHTAMAALNVVDWFKDTLEVERGEVKVAGTRECER